MMLSDICLMSDVCLSVAYIGPKVRTERPRKTKISTEVTHVTRDSDTTFKVKRSKVNLFDGQKRQPALIFFSFFLFFLYLNQTTKRSIE